MKPREILEIVIPPEMRDKVVNDTLSALKECVPNVEEMKAELKKVYDLRTLSGMDRGIIAQALHSLCKRKYD